jgi:ribosomal protein S18 acetylase RimI-like enzyme
VSDPGIRPYRPSDRADVVDVCVRTGAAGGDARGRYSSDALLAEVFALPYLDRDPELAWVVDDGERVIGYVLGAADTAGFVRWVREAVVPSFAERWAGAAGEDAAVVAMGLDPERMLVPEVVDFPAHLHIDLLPEAQGRGFGRTLIDTFCGALAARGVPGVHLTIDPANVRAAAFYRAVGFTQPRPATFTRSIP